MTTMTRTEYDTVERTIEYDVCDVCGDERNGDAETIELVANPVAVTQLEWDVVATFETRGEAATKLETAKAMQFAADEKYGIGKRQTVEAMSGDTVIHVCRTCFETVFDVATPDTYDELRFDGGEIKAVTIKQTTTAADMLFLVMVILAGIIVGLLLGVALL